MKKFSSKNKAAFLHYHKETKPFPSSEQECCKNHHVTLLNFQHTMDFENKNLAICRPTRSM